MWIMHLKSVINSSVGIKEEVEKAERLVSFMISLHLQKTQLWRDRERAVQPSAGAWFSSVALLTAHNVALSRKPVGLHVCACVLIPSSHITPWTLLLWINSLSIGKQPACGERMSVDVSLKTKVPFWCSEVSISQITKTSRYIAVFHLFFCTTECLTIFRSDELLDELGLNG